MQINLTPETAVAVFATALISKSSEAMAKLIDPVIGSFPEKDRLNAFVQLQALLVMNEKGFEEALEQFVRTTMENVVKEVNG